MKNIEQQAREMNNIVNNYNNCYNVIINNTNDHSEYPFIVMYFNHPMWYLNTTNTFIIKQKIDEYEELMEDDYI